MGVTVRERKGKWWVFVSHQGKRRAKCVGDRRAALDVKRRIEEELAKRSFHIEDQKVIRYEDLRREIVDDYEANKQGVEWLEDRLIHLDRAFRGQPANEIITSAIRAYIIQRQRQKAKNATVNRELGVLRRMFTLAKQAGGIYGIPYVPKLKEQNVRTGFFEWEDFQRLRAELPVYLRPYVTIAHYTGWRKQEILNLTWTQVDLHVGTVRLEPGTTKNREGRTVFLIGELLELFHAQKGLRDLLHPDCPWVVHHDGKRIRDFRHAWEWACKRAGLVGRIPHDFRRTAIRNMVRAGIPERVAMMISGHKTRSVFDRYDIVSGGDLLEAARKLQRFTDERAALQDLVATSRTLSATDHPEASKKLEQGKR